MLLAAGCGEKKEDPTIAFLDLNGYSLLLLRDTQRGVDEATMEVHAQHMVDSVHKYDNVLTDAQIRREIDRTIRGMQGVCEDCETLLRDARP